MKYYIIAGEASGDLHAANLMNELRNLDKDAQFRVWGGDLMQQQGGQIVMHYKELAFMGFLEVLMNIRRIKSNFELCQTDLLDFKPDLLILVDYPGFNLRMAKSFNKKNIKNIYYISPQIWAWGQKRINKIKKIISKMIVFFPFEKTMYEQNNIDVDFVGHPLVKKISNYKFLSKTELYAKHNLETKKELLVLLPGSRKQELGKIFPQTIEAAEKLSKELNLQTIIACADNIDEEYFRNYSGKYNFKIIKGDTYNLLKNAKFAIIKSGTSTLEAGIIGTPFIVVYATSFLTYKISKKLIKIKNIALANIVAGKTIVEELIQNDVNAETIYNKSKFIISNKEKYNLIKNELKEIKSKLETEGNPSKKAAEIIYAELLKA